MSRKPYEPTLPNTWWLEKPFYIRYMLREMTSFFVGAYVAILIVGLWQLSQGPDAWGSFLGVLSHPLSVIFHVLAFVFATFHTVTWFALTPRTTPIMRGDHFVPPGPIIGAQYVIWAAASIVVLAAVLW
ncbi:MAG: hypothetical protein VR70_06250 [Rhodospirillaceae bacterium BRH_c57]|nr:MAG: hypothetical protein VR70_06250 [Rhodospirillaceae bacterium BRH_c57]